MIILDDFRSPAAGKTYKKELHAKPETVMSPWSFWSLATKVKLAQARYSSVERLDVWDREMESPRDTRSAVTVLKTATR